MWIAREYKGRKEEKTACTVCAELSPSTIRGGSKPASKRAVSFHPNGEEVIAYTPALDQFSEKEKAAYWSSAPETLSYRCSACCLKNSQQERDPAPAPPLNADNAAKRMASILNQKQETVVLCHSKAQLAAFWVVLSDSYGKLRGLERLIFRLHKVTETPVASSRKVVRQMQELKCSPENKATAYKSIGKYARITARHTDGVVARRPAQKE